VKHNIVAFAHSNYFGLSW